MKKVWFLIGFPSSPLSLFRFSNVSAGLRRSRRQATGDCRMKECGDGSEAVIQASSLLQEGNDHLLL